MLTGIVVLLILICVAAIFSIGYRLKHATHHYLNLPTWLLWLASMLIVCGAVLTLFFSQQLTAEISQKSWPKADGLITASFVAGERAFRPDIEYRYLVAGDTLHGSSSLKQPGFGGRMNRLDAAEKQVLQYSVGEEITVHYQPDNPQISTLSPGPDYAVFLKLGNSGLLFVIALMLVLIRLLRPKFQNNP